MNQIKSIELCLENCEVLKFEADQIGRFEVKNIKNEISRIALNSISKLSTCEEFIIQISSKANISESYLTTWSNNNVLPFERINNGRDIVSVTINYEDGNKENIYVDWDGTYCENYLQSSYINKAGDLYIVVSKNKNVKDVF